MGAAPFSRPLAKCASTCHARAAVVLENFALRARIVAAKAACVARKPSTCEFRQAWRPADAFASQGKATQVRWGLRRATSILASKGGLIRFSSDVGMIYSRQFPSL